MLSFSSTDNSSSASCLLSSSKSSLVFNLSISSIKLLWLGLVVLFKSAEGVLVSTIISLITKKALIIKVIVKKK